MYNLAVMEKHNGFREILYAWDKGYKGLPWLLST